MDALARTRPPAPTLARAAERKPQTALAGGVLMALGLGALAIAETQTARLGLLFVLGAALGLVLYHAAFGFTGAWRVFIADGRGAGLRAQMAMLALATALFAPTLAQGTLFGQEIVGAVAPVGVSVLIGAFVFGLGMQLGGGCGSGTLYTAGGGNTRMAVTLGAFIVGSLIGTAHLPWWLERPSLGSISLIEAWGAGPAVAAQLAVFAAIVLATRAVERQRFGRVAPMELGVGFSEGARRFLRGPWPLLWGALGLAALNFATLGLAGHPWGITYAFGLWGAKIAQAAGLDVAVWEFWTWPYNQQALQASVFANTTSTMDFGILMGALLAAALAGKFAPVWRVPLRSLAAAILGGLLMGYGARLAFGCNIGAYFSGIASASVHGWVWFGAAMVGTAVGTRLRPLFGLDVERSAREA